MFHCCTTSVELIPPTISDACTSLLKYNNIIKHNTNNLNLKSKNSVNKYFIHIYLINLLVTTCIVITKYIHFIPKQYLSNSPLPKWRMDTKINS